MAPLIQDAFTGGGIDTRATGGVAPCSGFQRGRGDIEGGTGAAHVVEERVVTQAGEHPKVLLLALNSLLATGITACAIELIQAAFGSDCRVEIALDRGSRGSFSRSLAAIDAE